MALAHICLLVLVAMATGTHQATDEEVAPSNMTLEQAQAMFRQSFQEMDLNHDHLVDLREFMEPYLVHDHDKNMVVTLSEFLQQAPEEENQEYLSSDFRFHDANHDGSITVPEMQHQFNNIDTDENHEISQEEFVAFGTQLFIDKAHPAFQQPPVGK